MGTVMEIESTREWKAALKAAKAARMLTFAMFYVPRSRACKSIGPTFTQLASQYAHVVFLKVDVTKNRRIEQRYNIDQVPTFIVYRGERLVDGLFKPSRREIVALAARCFAVATNHKPDAAPLPVANDPTPVNTHITTAAAFIAAEAERAKAEGTAAADPHIIGKPIEIESILQWNTFLTPTTKDEHLVLVQFYSPANRECKSITPTFTQLAAQYPKVTFLRVNATAKPGTPIAQSPGAAIAQKYKVDMLPFFWLFSGGLPVDGMMGSDALSLRELAARRFGVASAVPSGVTSVAPGPGVAAAVPKVGTTIPVEADIAKAQGNAAFAVGDYTTAAAHYSRAVELAPKWAVPCANRALAYMKLIGEEETEEDLRNGTPKAQSNQLRPRAMEDAYMATLLDERWGKGWVRLAQVMLMEAEVEEAEKREEGIRKMLGGAQAALYNAAGLSEGRVLKEAQKMMEDVTARLKAL
ncbi:thioredoxin-like protein [Schizophyllum commune Tattone D]|nr:thioredoxin-like protein [Schizophyllum commune Tattone D]